MRYAVISDVHANEAALRMVLTDAGDARADMIVCLGDVIGYGPDPVAALELVHRHAHVCLAGNHDAAVAGRFPTDDFTSFAAAALHRHREALSKEAVDWLGRLPYVCEFDGFACAHGDFSAPADFNYIIEPEDALPSWSTQTEQLLFVGHTHRPGIFVIGASGTPHRLDAADFVLEDGKRYVVNPGSVGYPRNGACRISYCIYDDLARTVVFRSLPFDLESYSAKMREQGLDEAPWMLERTVERRRPAVRRDVRFSSDGNGVAPPSRRFPQRATLVASCLFAAMAPFAVLLLFRELPNGGKPSSTPANDVREVPPPTSAVAVSVRQDRFGPARELADGWTCAVEDPDGQKISLDFNGARGERVFRIDHSGMHTVRFAKRIELRPQQEYLAWNVKRIRKHRGRKYDFRFTTRLVFFDGGGVRLSMQSGGGKFSEKSKPCRVPAEAACAVLYIDCICQGTHELPVPQFGACPRKRGK